MNEAYWKLAFAALLPVVTAMALYLIGKRPFFARRNATVRSLLCGVIFGGLAILGTEWGIPLSGAQANCRDASVLIAGLLFGAPAGITAGLIGGIERWFAVAWGVGSFTRVACTVSTILAGFYSALLRKYMFEDKKPGWLISFAIGVVMEVFHLTMVFVTNMATPVEAMAAVRACTIPMVLANGASVLLASFAVTLLAHEAVGFRRETVRISQTIQRWLLITVFLAFSATSYFVFQLQTSLALVQADSMLDLALEETALDIRAGGDSVRCRHVGEGGYLLIFDEAQRLLSAPEGFSSAEPMLSAVPETDDTFSLTVDGVPCYCRCRTVEGRTLLSVLPQSEALKLRNIALYVNTFMEILVFAVLFALIYLLIRRVVVDQIKRVNASLARITGGNLDEVVNVRSNAEFASLSDDINATVGTLKHYIAEASARIDAELGFARSIQSSALPSVFPAFPKRRDFDIYALMDPAKEVGGDFYDLYMTGSDTLHFLVADVSGKGIPASLFMMRAKTELKTLTESDLPLGDVFTRGNAALCEGNDAGMFVTAWQGDLDLATGTVRFANAGHNPPLLRHADGSFSYLRSRAGFVLGGMDGTRYQAQELSLAPGDEIFLYTDGVTEATDANGALYGEERLLRAVNACPSRDACALCRFIKADVDAFVGDAPQFDDITMLSLRYLGTPTEQEIHFERASLEDIPVVTEFCEKELEKLGCPEKVAIPLDVAIDELYSNIVHYAYPDGPGPVTVRFRSEEEPRSVSLSFLDRGTPYDPLQAAEPDVALSADERRIGGLGIYLVRKSMDDVQYEYRDGQNILTIRKKL